MSLIALITSCSLFGILATVRRPFEAHLFKFGYQPIVNPSPTPVVSRKPSRTASFASEKYVPRVSASTHRSTPSNHSNADVETLNLDPGSPTSTIHSPSPVRSIGLGIFTSQAQPPPLPLAFVPTRSSSLMASPPPTFKPSTSLRHLPPPPRMSSLVAPSGFVPLSIPASYSQSTLRAIHPTIPSPLGGPTASRSMSHIPHSTGKAPKSTYQNRHSRSLVSLTRPHRLSSAPASTIALSSIGSDEGRASPVSGGGSNSISRSDSPSANAIAYAILNGTPIPNTQAEKVTCKVKHVRRASAPDYSATSYNARRTKGWKPHLEGQEEAVETTPSKVHRASSVDLIKDKISPDNFARELERRLGLAALGSLRKSRSESPLRHSEISREPANVDVSATLCAPPKDSTSSQTRSKGRRVPPKEAMLEEVTIKPLSKIAAWLHRRIEASVSRP